MFSNDAFDAYSEEELSALIKAGEKALIDRQTSRRNAVISQIKSLAKDAGIEIRFLDDAEIQAGKDKRTGITLPAKFTDGNGNTWTGRGFKPKWLTNYIEAGHSLDEFRIA